MRLRRSTVLIALPDGTVRGYAKIHLFDAFGFLESDTVDPGDEPVTFSAGGLTVGVATCYDIRFPELYRALADDGATVLLVSHRRSARDIADRIVAHRAVPLNRAQRRARCLQPFARGPDGIAARRALAFQHPHRLLPGPSSRAACIESAMGKGTDRSEDRCNGGKEGVPGGGGAHWPDQPQPD